MTANNGGPPDFYSICLDDPLDPCDPALGFSLGAVINLTSLVFLPSGTGYQMNVITYDLVGSNGTATEVEFCDTLGSPRL